MPRVICTLPHAGEVINGFKFERLEDGSWMSEELDQAQAMKFASIRGYEIYDEPDDDNPLEPEPEPEPKPNLEPEAAKPPAKAGKRGGRKAKAADDAAETKEAESAQQPQESDEDQAGAEGGAADPEGGAEDTTDDNVF